MKRKDIVVICLVLVLMAISFSLGYYGSPLENSFCLIALVEIVLAITNAEIAKSNRNLNIVILLTAVFLPFIVAYAIPGWKPAGMAFIVYFLISAIAEFAPRTKSKEEIAEKDARNFPDPKIGVIYPDYVPQGFILSKIKPYPFSRGGPRGIELTYQDNYSRKIKIVKYRGSNPYITLQGGMETVSPILNGVKIEIRREILNRSVKFDIKRRQPFLESDWMYNNFAYNLRSDGLTLEEAEKVIASMITEEKPQ